jgi:hypothetical protein
MKPCKEKLPDGKPCPNQADEGQEYCPYHLANQDKQTKSVLAIVGTVLSVVAAGIIAIVKIATKRT